MAGRSMLALALCFALTCRASAQTLSQAGSLLAEGNWREAEASAKLLPEQSPDHADAQAILGIALYHQGRFEEAIPAFQTAIAQKTSYEPRVLYYLGLAQSKCGRVDDATDAFMRLMTLHPKSTEAQRLRGLSADVTVPAERRSSMDMSGTVISLEAGYDTNPDLVDGGDGDALALVYAYTDLSLESMPCLIGMSFVFEKYLDLTENDFAELALNLNDQFQLGANGLAEWSVEIGQSLLDYEAFERSLSASIEYSQRWGGVWMGRLRADGALIDADEEGYDATRARLRLRAYRYMQHAGAFKWVRLTAQTRTNSRDADWLAYNAVTAGVDSRLQIPWDMSLDLGVHVESRWYDGEDPQTLETRKDDLIEFSAFAVKPVRKGQYLTGQATYTTRDSNDDFYAADELRLLIGALWVK
jgi:tetratricopeptide (TPR) repeat protein